VGPQREANALGTRPRGARRRQRPGWRLHAEGGAGGDALRELARKGDAEVLVETVTENTPKAGPDRKEVPARALLVRISTEGSAVHVSAGEGLGKAVPLTVIHVTLRAETSRGKRTLLAEVTPSWSRPRRSMNGD
jgi:hypothetical protein